MKNNFDLKKYLVENKATRNSQLLKENKENFSVELLVPTIYFNVETGELADTAAAFGADSELEDMDITNYSDGDELIEFVFDGSLEKAKSFEKEYPGLFKVKESELNEGMFDLQTLSDYKIAFDIAAEIGVGAAAVGFMIYKAGIKKTIEVLKHGAKEFMAAVKYFTSKDK